MEDDEEQVAPIEPKLAEDKREALGGAVPLAGILLDTGVPRDGLGEEQEGADPVADELLAIGVPAEGLANEGPEDDDLELAVPAGGIEAEDVDLEPNDLENAGRPVPFAAAVLAAGPSAAKLAPSCRRRPAHMHPTGGRVGKMKFAMFMPKA